MEETLPLVPEPTDDGEGFNRTEEGAGEVPPSQAEQPDPVPRIELPRLSAKDFDNKAAPDAPRKKEPTRVPGMEQGQTHSIWELLQQNLKHQLVYCYNTYHENVPGGPKYVGHGRALVYIVRFFSFCANSLELRPANNLGSSLLALHLSMTG